MKTIQWGKGDRFHVSGDSADLWLEDYNVRVDTEGTILEDRVKGQKKMLVTLDRIDGEGNVTAYIRASRLRRISPSKPI